MKWSLKGRCPKWRLIVDDLNDAIFEPRTESLSSRRRQAAYEDSLKLLDNNFDFDE